MAAPSAVRARSPAAPALPVRTSTLVIGGGPSGLVALRYALEYGPGWTHGESPVLVEAEADIGGTFRYRGYENAELVSSKQLTCFSDFRYPLVAPDHPSLPNFVEYLRAYARKFGLVKHIHCRTRVVRLDKLDGEHPHRAVLSVTLGGQGRPEITHEHVLLARRVVITTGLHVTPNIPDIPGLTAEPLPARPVRWMHSSSYNAREQLKDKAVLVVGAGETGMDLGYEAILAPASKVWLAVLNNFRILWSTFDGALPIDGLITNLFETAYVHPWVSASHLRWFVSDYVIRRVLWLMTGTMAGCNQWAGELPPERQGRAYVFLNKSGKAMQFINQPFQSMSMLHRAFFQYQDPPLPALPDGIDPTIHIVPFPERVDADGNVVFPAPPPHRSKETAWKQPCRPDLVVLATGYRQDWSWLGEGYPRGPDACDIRGVCSSSDLSVAFIGFLRPGVGAIPPMAEMQAQLFFLLTQGKIPIPRSPENYHLLHAKAARIQYGVDYSTYMATLARDMGSAPGVWELAGAHGWFVAFVYCFGAAFVSLYRLVGPYRSALAPEIARTELWDTIRRRGVIGNLFMAVIPMAFYALVNLAALTLDIGWCCLAILTGGTPPPGSVVSGEPMRPGDDALPPALMFGKPPANGTPPIELHDLDAEGNGAAP